MAYTRYRTANFGKSKGGLSTVGYTLQGGSRVTAGIAEVGTTTGIYGALVSFADGFTGSILWDTGDGASIAYVGGAINPGSDERLDAKISAVTFSGDLILSEDGFDLVLDAPARIAGGTLRQALQDIASGVVGDFLEVENADGTATTTTAKAYRDPDTNQWTSVATPTARTMAFP